VTNAVNGPVQQRSIWNYTPLSETFQIELSPGYQHKSFHPKRFAPLHKTGGRYVERRTTDPNLGLSKTFFYQIGEQPINAIQTAPLTSHYPAKLPQHVATFRI
jgi:hypothetical protein